MILSKGKSAAWAAAGLFYLSAICLTPLVSFASAAENASNEITGPVIGIDLGTTYS